MGIEREEVILTQCPRSFRRFRKIFRYTRKERIDAQSQEVNVRLGSDTTAILMKALHTEFHSFLYSGHHGTLVSDLSRLSTCFVHRW